MTAFLKLIHTGLMNRLMAKKVCTGDIEMFIVPLLSFDKNSNRIGYNKGYYNRFLKQCCSNSSTIGLSYFDVVEYEEDINKA